MALADNLVAYYSLGEASGNALDAHGSNDLTDFNTCGSRTGKVGGARDFVRGRDEYMSRSSAAAFNLGNADFTGQAWVLIDSIAPGSEEEFVSLHDDFVQLWSVTEDAGKFQFRISGAANLVSSQSPTTGVWHHIMFWHDATNNTIGISVNGNVTTASYSGGVSVASSPVFGLNLNYSNRHFDGAIDEVGFWSRVLTSGERTDLYNSGAGRDYDYITGGGGGGGSPLLQAMMQYSFTGGCL